MAIDQKPRRSTEREQEEGQGGESLREYSQRYDPLGAPPPYHYHSTSSSSSSPPEGMHETQPHSESTPLLSGQESQRSHDARAAPWAPAWQRKPLSARRKRVVNVCLVLVLLTLIIVSMREWATHSSSDQPDSGSAPGSGSGDYPLPPSPAPNDGNPKSRASWSSPVERPDYPVNGGPWYSSVANFTLKYTPDYEAVWLHALGVSYRGHITVVGDSAVKEGEGEVGVEAFFRSVREREHAVWVGEMKRGEKDEGLGVYVSKYRGRGMGRVHLSLAQLSSAHANLLHFLSFLSIRRHRAIATEPTIRRWQWRCESTSPCHHRAWLRSSLLWKWWRTRLAPAGRWMRRILSLLAAWTYSWGRAGCVLG